MPFPILYILRFFIMILLSTTIYASSSSKSLSYLNNIRSHAGMLKLKPHRALARSASAHATYLIYHQQSSHFEKRRYKKYTGKTPAQRAIKAGYGSASVMENLTINTKGATASIDNLFSAIYHRFVFLSFDKDEIGLGVKSTQRKRKFQRAFVYNLGSSSVSTLCKQYLPMRNGLMYLKGLCKNKDKLILQSQYNTRIKKVQRKNPAMILYPYSHQKNVSPAFYNESPDPLPSYKVSGFPVSVQFNPSRYKKIKLLSFRLYNSKNREIKKTKILTKKSDHNHKFSAFEFALMPLERLDYNQRYTAKISIKADNKKLHKSWSFHTQKFSSPLHTIVKNKSYFKIKSGSTHIFYIKPKSRRDICKSYKARGKIKVSFIDSNTIKVYFSKRRSRSKAQLTLGARKLYFDIK